MLLRCQIKSTNLFEHILCLELVEDYTTSITENRDKYIIECTIHMLFSTYIKNHLPINSNIKEQHEPLYE